MGWWGAHSHEGDLIWDHLWAKDIHAMTAKEVRESIEKFIKEHPLPWDLTDKTYWIFRTYLGIVVHAVFQGRRVPKEHLDRALRLLNDIFLNKDVMEFKSNGSDPASTKYKALQIEKAAIEYALAHKCRGKVQHCPGVLEQMANMFGGKA